MDLRANAIITAVDRFSGPMARMAGATRAFSSRAGALVSQTQRAGRTLAGIGTTAGVPASILGAIALRGEYDVDRISRQMQAVGEISDQQRKMLVDNAFQTSIGVGEGADSLLKAQKELIQGGLDPETVGRMTETVAKAAKTNAMEMSMVAEDAINVARGLGFAFDTTEEKTASLTKALNFMSVVPALSTEGWEGLRESLKYSAPVASMLNIEVEKLGAALSILADRGFKGEEGGTAFRTMLLRGIGPTKKLTDAYRAAGIQIEDLYKLDNGMIADKGRLRERLLAAGWAGKEKEIDSALSQVGGPEKYDGLYKYQDALQDKLADSLDVSDAQDKRTLKKAVDQHIFSAMNGFDLEKFFTALRKLPLSDFKEVAGIQRTSQARALLEDLERLAPLTEDFRRMIPDSVDRRFEDIDRGFAQSIDKMVERFKFARHNIFDAGLGKDLETAFDGVASAVEGFAKMNPEALSTLVKGGVMTGLAAGIGAIAASPWARAVAAITALSVGIGNFDPKKGLLGHASDAMNGDGAAPAEAGNQGWLEWMNSKLKHMVPAEQMLLGSDTLKNWGWESFNDFVARRRNSSRGGSMPFDPMTGEERGGMVRDIDPTAGPQTIDVTGKVDANVQGTVAGQMDVNIKIEGPGVVTSKTGGDLKGTLNTGKSMPDAGSSGRK